MEPGLTQKNRVLRAYQHGCRSTWEVAEETGLSIHHCASYTHQLIEAGLIRKSGLAARWSHKGQQPYWYEPVDAAKAL